MSDARLGRRRPGTGGYREREDAPRRGSEYESLSRFSRQEDFYEESEEETIPWSEFDEERPRRTKRRQQNGVLKLFSALGPILYFPMMLFYLELAFHIYMGEGIHYFPVWLFFSVSMGFFFSLFYVN